jgi:hypothetical protein
MHDTPPSYTRRCTTDCAYVTDGNKILKAQLVLPCQRPQRAILMQFSQRGVKSPKYTFLQFSTQVCPKSPPNLHAAPRGNLRKKCYNIIQKN